MEKVKDGWKSLREHFKVKVISKKVKCYQDILAGKLSSTSTLEKNVVRLKIVSKFCRLVKDAMMLWNKRVMCKSRSVGWSERKATGCSEKKGLCSET